MSVLQISMQHESVREPQVPLRPSELYTFAPYRWNPTHLIPFARLGDLPILRRYHPRSFASCIPSWPWRKRSEPSSLPLSDMPGSPGVSPLADALQVPPAPPPSVPDPCATETVVKALRALKPDRKTPTEEVGDPSSPAQENKPRSQDSIQGRQSSSLPEAASRDPPAPSVAKPGSEESTTTASSSSSSSTSTPAKRVARNNNILSSYSSSGGIERLWIEAGLDLSQIKRFMPPTEELMGWSWRTLMEERKAKANKNKTSSSSKKVDKEVQVYIPPQPVELPLPRWIIPPSPPLLVNGRPWRGSRLREVRLFHQSKEPLIMPPAPDPGYKITRADYDADREERWRQFKRGLDDSKDSPPPVDNAPTPAVDPSAVTGGGPEGQSHEQFRQNYSGQAGVPCATLGAPPVPGLPPHSLPTGATGGPANPPSTEATPQPCPPSPPTAVAVPPPPSNAFQPVGDESSLAIVQTSIPKPSILFGMFTSPLEGQPTVGTGDAMPIPAAAATGSTLFPPVFGSPAQSQNPWGGSGGDLTPMPSTATPSYTFQPIFGNLQPISTTGPANTVPTVSSTFDTQPSLPRMGVLPTGGFPGFSGPLQSPGSGAATMTTNSIPCPLFNQGIHSWMASGPLPGGGATGSLLFGTTASPLPPTSFGASFSQAHASGAAPPMATGTNAMARPSFAAPMAVTTPSPFGHIHPHAFWAKQGTSDDVPPPAKVTALGLEHQVAPLSIPALGASQATGGGGGGGGSSSNSDSTSPAQKPIFGAISTPQLAFGGGGNGGSGNSSLPAQNPFGRAAFRANSTPQLAFGGGGNGGSGISSPLAQNLCGGTTFGAKRAPQPAFGGSRSRSPPAQNPFGDKRAPQPAFGGSRSRSLSAHSPFGGAAFGAHNSPLPGIVGQSVSLSLVASTPGGPTIITTSSSAFGIGAQSPSITNSGGSGDLVLRGPAAPSAALLSFGASAQAPQVSPVGASAFGRRVANSGLSGGNGNGSSSSATVGTNHTSQSPFRSCGVAAGPSSIEDRLIYAFRNGPPHPYVMPPPHEMEKSIKAVAPLSFSISSGTRMGTRQHLQARRQHLKKN